MAESTSVFAKKDKEYLLAIGYHERELEHIEAIMGPVEFSYKKKGKKISQKKARELLGDKLFLSGLIRCAYSGMAMRTCGNGYVGFEKIQI